jgi:hypothetical protein
LAIKPLTFTCYACGIGGDAFELVQRVRGRAFPEAPAFVVEFAGKEWPGPVPPTTLLGGYGQLCPEPAFSFRLADGTAGDVLPALAELLISLADQHEWGGGARQAAARRAIPEGRHASLWSHPRLRGVRRNQCGRG